MDAQLQALSVRIGAALKRHQLMLATAESCTGGWIAQTVTATAGSSEWFERGFVTYSNAAKQESLDVRADTLRRHGAVSEDTAREMAAGVLKHSHAQVALAITGIAGPAGGTPDKPVGTVCFAWCRSNGTSRSATEYFVGDREVIRRQSVIHALEGLLGLLSEP